MPIYEYQCTACNKEFELLVKNNSDISCSFCGSRDISKKISSFAFSVSRTPGTPSCASTCNDGFNQGTCGSGMCCGT